MTCEVWVIASLDSGTEAEVEATKKSVCIVEGMRDIVSTFYREQGKVI